MLLVSKPIDDEVQRLHAVIVFRQALQRHDGSGRALFIAARIFDLHGRILIRPNDDLVFFQAEI